MHRRHSRIGNAKLVINKEHFFIKRYNLYYDTCTLSNVSFKAVPSMILFSVLFLMSSSFIIVRIRADAW